MWLKTPRNLQRWEPRAAISHAEDVEVSGTIHMLPVLLPSIKRSVGNDGAEEDRRTIFVLTIRSSFSSIGRFMGDRNVGEFRIVGRAGRANGIPRLEAIRVHVVTGILGNGIGEVPRVDEREVVGVVG